MQPNAVPKRGGRELATGCVVLFMLPFFAAGAFVMYEGVRAWRRGEGAAHVAMFLLFGAIFCGFALMLVAVAVFGTRSVVKQIALRTAEPDRPWLWHADWAAGVLRYEGDPQSWFLWPFALIWNAICAACYPLLRRELFGEHHYWFGLVLIFPAAGLLLLYLAIAGTLRRAKFGVSTLTLNRIPLRPGTSFSGELRARVRNPPSDGFRFALQSLRIVTSGDSEGRTTTEHVLSEDVRIVSAAVAAPSPDGMRVPFSFDVPADGQPTDERDMDDRLAWRLNVFAGLPGVDYTAQFELPVFGTAAATAHDSAATYRVAHRQEMARRELPPDSQVAIELQPNGATVFRIGARRDFRSVVSLSVFAAIWIAAIVVMVKVSAPFILVLFFTLFALLLIAGVVDAAIGRARVEVDSSGLTIERSWGSYKSTTRIAAEDVESVVPKPIGSSKRAAYDVEVRVRNRATSRTLGCYLREKDVAEIVAARISFALRK